MRLASALRWAAIYRGIVWVTGLLPLGTALGALYFVGPNRLPRGLGEAIGIATTPFFLLPVVAALLVWQFVASVAFYKTVAEATDEQMAERFDSEKVKSEVLEVLDDRLAEMQTELQRARRDVKESGAGATGGTAQATAGGGTGFGDANAGGTGSTGAGGTGGAGGGGSGTGDQGGGDDTGGFDFES